MKKNLLHSLLMFLLLLGLRAHAATPPPTGRPLTEALNLDGTLKTGANGSFDARQFRMGTAPDGRPVFRPAGTAGAGDERWQNGFGLPNGANGVVSAVLRVGNDVYIGGSFTAVGAVSAGGVAKWNGTAWSSLGTGVASGALGTAVNALAVARNGDLYVGGNFSQAGGVAANNVAKWNGAAWSSLGAGSSNGVGGFVYALVVAGNGDVYAGGNFTQAGGALALRIARWNGTSWSSLSTAIANGVSGTVYALAATINGDLYAGGSFNTAGGTTVGRVARWDGANWSMLGISANYGVNGFVYALAVAGNGDVYAGGDFVIAGGVSAIRIARWNGTAWNALGAGITASPLQGVRALVVAANGDVYAGGNFTQAGGVAASNVAQWNGTTWSSLGTGTNERVAGLAIEATGKLYAGGSFTATGDGSKAMAHFGIYDPAAPLATTAAKATPAAQLFPNPAHGTVTLRLPAGAPRQPLTLTDALGRIVRRYPAPATAEAELDLRGLPAGVYVVSCGDYSQRLVVE